MVQRPLANEAGSLFRQAAMDDLTIGNANEGFETLIDRVEMGRRMLVVVHADHDAEKTDMIGTCPLA